MDMYRRALVARKAHPCLGEAPPDSEGNPSVLAYRVIEPPSFRDARCTHPRPDGSELFGRYVDNEES